ncbi:MAG: hypothetical protein ACK4S4_13130 [Pyrinomonadaceae bacterium]
MNFRHDDPVPINKNAVRFVTNDVAYVYVGWKYAVTTDGGEHWAVWDAEQNWPGWQCCKYSFIRHVELAADGSGKMQVDDSQNETSLVELTTSNYGESWSY